MQTVAILPERIPEDERNATHGTLHLWPSGALFIGGDMVNSPHRHFTASIIVGLSGKVGLRAEPNPEFEGVDAAMVAPNVDQQLDARGSRVAILQVDPESRGFGRIAHHFVDHDVRKFEEPVVSKLREILKRADDPSSGRSAYDAVLDELATPGAPSPPIDPRIRKVLGIVKSDFLSTPPAEKLASAVGLSSGRLIHLFTREMGLPIRRYILWLRLRDVLISVALGSTLTEAAHRAGFSDSAHLSRTFRGMFGFPPSWIGEQKGRIRIFLTETAAQDPDSPHPPVDEERLLASGKAGAKLSDARR